MSTTGKVNREFRLHQQRLKMKATLVVLAFVMNMNFLKAQNADLWTMEGIIIIPSYSYLPDTIPKPIIPQDVLLIPCELGNAENREDRVEQCLANQKEIGYMIYFQAIRWIQPALVEDLANAWSTNIAIRNIHGPKLNSFHPVQATTVLLAGKITFDRKNNKHREWKDDTEVYQLSVTMKNNEYEIEYVECPGDFGVPKLFTPIND